MDQPLFDSFNRATEAAGSGVHDGALADAVFEPEILEGKAALPSGADADDPGIPQPVNWIVSFPRSGNTFIRSLFANYASGLDRPMTMSELAAASWGEHSEEFLAPLTGKQPQDRTHEEEWRVRPAYFDKVRTRINRLMPMIKSHTPVGEVYGLRAFDFAVGDKVIQIVRHPCDVVVSVADYYNFSIDKAIDQVLKLDTCYYGAPDQGYELVGSWSQHTRSWMKEMPVPMARFSYDALIENPVNILVELLKFIGFCPDQNRAEQSVEFCRFGRMKSAAAAEGFSETASTAQNGYFREGKPDQWLDKLTVNQARRVLDHDPELIALFGFSRLSVS